MAELYSYHLAEWELDMEVVPLCIVALKSLPNLQLKGTPVISLLPHTFLGVGCAQQGDFHSGLLCRCTQTVTRARVIWRLARSGDWCLACTTPTAEVGTAETHPAPPSPCGLSSTEASQQMEWESQAEAVLLLGRGLRSHIVLLCHTLIVEAVTKACPPSQGRDRCSTSWWRKSKF